MMPRNGAAARSEQLGTLSKIVHTMFAAPEVGKLLDEAEPWAEEQGYDSQKPAFVRVVRRDYDKLVRVPPELTAELSRTAAVAEPVWEEARKQSDWAMFQPYLEKVIELAAVRPVLRARGRGLRPPARRLRAWHEDGRGARGVRRAEGGARAAHRRDRRARGAVDDSFLAGEFPIDAQKHVEGKILADFGFTADSWRLDETVHPFATRSGMDDIRLTTRHHEDNMQLDLLLDARVRARHLRVRRRPRLRAHAVARGTSLALHESQSRMWENLVGRSRPFWQHYYPLVQDAFSSLNGVDAEGFYRAVNRVKPSLIRIDADEATYNLHIILRFELEQEMITGRLAAADVPRPGTRR